MRTTIDASGRLVVPKSIRGALRFEAGQELELTARDGRLEIEAPATPMPMPAPAATSLTPVWLHHTGALESAPALATEADSSTWVGGSRLSRSRLTSPSAGTALTRGSATLCKVLNSDPV